MLDKRARTYVAVVFAFGLAISLPISWVISHLHPVLLPQKEQGIRTSDHNAGQEGSQAPQPESFGERLTSDPVAFFTMALAFITGGLAVYTALLWRSTSKLVSGADLNAQNQLRAYIGVFSTAIEPQISDAGSAISAQVTMRNSGATPAYDFKSWLAIEANAPDAVPFWFPLSLDDRPASIVGPNMPIDLTISFATTPEVIQSVHTRVRTLFFWGRVEYRDAFGSRRFFVFRMINGGFMPVAKRWTTSPHVTGYEAN